MAQNNVPLSDIMGDVPYKNSFDMTSGRLVHVEDEQPVPVVKKAVPIQTGYVDVSNMKPVEATDILPKRTKPDNDGMTDDQLSELDAAVDRECASITERHKAFYEMQQQEIAAKEAEDEEDEMKKIDAFALGDVERSTASSITSISTSTYDYNSDQNTSTSSTEATHFTNVTPNMGFDDGSSETAVSKNDNFVSIPSAPAVEATKEDTDMPIAGPRPISVDVVPGIKNEELFDDEEETSTIDDTESNKEMLEDLKAQVKEKIGPIKRTLDLSKFSINQKAVSAQKVMKLVVTNNQNAADWVLPNAGKMISMTGLSGPEILKLNPENTNRNRMNTFRDMYRVMYDHLLDGNKPEFETWLKQLRFVDLQHVYFALYMATFGGSNFVSYSCPNENCKKVFIHDVDFKDMVIYADDKVKEKVRKIMTGDSTSTSNDSYESTLVQISDKYAFAIRTPSVWNVIMETVTLNDKFLEEYADQIDLITYIDAAYIIDAEAQTLTPIDTKPDPNDMAKTAARRIVTMYNIISKLSSEEYYNLRSVINEFDSSASDVTYRIPKCRCPKCNTDIAEVESQPSEMLFTRHQLAAFGSM